MKKHKLIALIIVLMLIGAFFLFDLGQYLDLQYLKSRQAELDAWYRDNPTFLIAGYFFIYVIVTGLSLPGAAVMTLIGGAIFGLLAGVIIVSFASTIGANSRIRHKVVTWSTSLYQPRNEVIDHPWLHYHIAVRS